MKKIKVPSITANEDVVKLSEILIKEKDRYIKKNEVICVLESSKTSFEFLCPEDGYVNYLFNEGDEVKIGEIFLLISEKKFEKKDLEEFSINKSITEDRKISRKARILIDENKINIDDIKKNGIISSSDVMAYIEDNFKSKENNNTNPDYYSELESIMKKDYKNAVSMKDIENLKDQLSYSQKKYQEKWNRYIPPLDVLFDRWKNGENFGFGENSNVSSMSYIIGDVKVGKNCYIGPFTILDGSGGLEIGDNTSIAAGVQIYSHDTVSRTLSGGKLSMSRARVSIGNNCFIGPSAIVTRGLKIGNMCFLGANSVLTFNLDDNQAASGNPCKIIGNVEIDQEGISIKKK